MPDEPEKKCPGATIQAFIKSDSISDHIDSTLENRFNSPVTARKVSIQNLKEDLLTLKDQIIELSRLGDKLLQEHQAGKADIAELRRTITALEEKERLNFLLGCVNQDAQGVLLQSEELRRRFLNSKDCTAFIIS